MAKFVYRMQNILNIKEKLETQAKNEFAIASANLAREEATLETLNRRKDGYEELLKQLYLDNLDIPKITEAQNAVELLKYQIKLQQIRVKSAEKELVAARVKLRDAMVERKTHDRLKEREFEQFLADEARAENKVIDELVSYRFGQKNEE